MFELPISQLKVKFAIIWTCGAMDNASAYGAEDSRFESWQVRYIFANLAVEDEIL